MILAKWVYFKYAARANIIRSTNLDFNSQYVVWQELTYANRLLLKHHEVQFLAKEDDKTVSIVTVAENSTPSSEWFHEETICMLSTRFQLSIWDNYGLVKNYIKTGRGPLKVMACRAGTLLSSHSREDQLGTHSESNELRISTRPWT